MPRRSTLLVAAWTALAAGSAGAQQRVPGDTVSLGRALVLEGEGKPREAAALYRAALHGSTATVAILGLERAYAELGWVDTLLVVVDSAVRSAPRDPTMRTVQLRTLTAAGRPDAARAAYAAWSAAAPGDPAPYREYARLLLQDNLTAAADSVLRTAAVRLGDVRQLALEVAQLRAALGRWESAAEAWRTAVEGEEYLYQAAVYSLSRAPAERRDGVRRALAPGNPGRGVRRALAGLELAWGAPARAWEVIGGLPPNEKGLEAWTAFGEEAEQAGAWGAARDAFSAVVAVRPDAPTVGRAAEAALAAGDARGALDVLTHGSPRLDAAGQRTLLPLRVKALVALGRPADAERLLGEVGASLDEAGRGAAMQSVAWGWVRAGDVARARAALAAAGSADGVDAVEGWLALYEGDLRTARQRFRRAGGSSPELVDALSLLSRTTADTSVATGRAFLALARGDTLAAAVAFAAAAPGVRGATPLLLARAARLYAARAQTDQAVAVWALIIREHARSPEAPEADLEWGRALRRAGNAAGAAERFEHLILTYPDSALVAQARRELDSLRNASVSLSS